MKDIDTVKNSVMREKIPCTVGILTFNSGETIRRCLDSVKYFDEIIICDGGSLDNTLLIAKQYGCTILPQDSKFKYKDDTIRDFSGARNQIINASAYQWFVSIDSDEYFTPDLVEEIRDIVASHSPTAYWVPRKYVFKGRIIECTMAYPSQQMRFFHLDTTRGFEKEVHERVGLKQNVSVETLRNFMVVPVDENIKALRLKQNRYIAIDVERSPEISLRRYFVILLINIKIIALYMYRFTRDIFFCRGGKLPLRYELNTILYHIKLALAFYSKAKRR